MQIATIGIDLAKNVFQLHAVDADGATVVRKRLRRAEVLPFLRRLSSALAESSMTPPGHDLLQDRTVALVGKLPASHVPTASGHPRIFPQPQPESIPSPSPFCRKMMPAPSVLTLLMRLPHRKHIRCPSRARARPVPPSFGGEATRRLAKTRRGLSAGFSVAPAGRSQRKASAHLNGLRGQARPYAEVTEANFSRASSTSPRAP